MRIVRSGTRAIPWLDPRTGSRSETVEGYGTTSQGLSKKRNVYNILCMKIPPNGIAPFFAMATCTAFPIVSSLCPNCKKSRFL